MSPWSGLANDTVEPHGVEKRASQGAQGRKRKM